MIDKIAWIHTENKKILSARTDGKDVFYIPGGKRDGNETDLETLVREIKEELSVDIKPETVKLYGVFEAQAHNKPEGVIIHMACYTADFTGILRPDSEIAEMRWLTTADKSIISLVDRIIFDQLRDEGEID